jgi:hypothetical protein
VRGGHCARGDFGSRAAGGLEEKLATDKHRWAQIKKCRIKFPPKKVYLSFICVNLWLESRKEESGVPASDLAD